LICDGRTARALQVGGRLFTQDRELTSVKGMGSFLTAAAGAGAGAVMDGNRPPGRCRATL